MREIEIRGRVITIRHVDTMASADGAIQEYEIAISSSNVVTCQWSTLQESTDVTASVTANAIDTELLLDYEGSWQSGLLRDQAVRAWRDSNRSQIQETVDHLRSGVFNDDDSSMSGAEQALRHHFDLPE